MSDRTNGTPCAQEGYDLMAAAFEVHSTVGGGLLEEICQECLEIELEMQQLPFQPKKQLQVYYKNRRLNKRYIPDFVVCESIVVELKVVSTLTAEHEGQLMNYMRISRSPVGYLINFAPLKKLVWKRFALSEFVH